MYGHERSVGTYRVSYPMQCQSRSDSAAFEDPEHGSGDIPLSEAVKKKVGCSFHLPFGHRSILHLVNKQCLLPSSVSAGLHDILGSCPDFVPTVVVTEMSTQWRHS
jgi:hypothetical protein